MAQAHPATGPRLCFSSRAPCTRVIISPLNLHISGAASEPGTSTLVGSSDPSSLDGSSVGSRELSFDDLEQLVSEILSDDHQDRAVAGAGGASAHRGGSGANGDFRVPVVRRCNGSCGGGCHSCMSGPGGTMEMSAPSPQQPPVRPESGFWNFGNLFGGGRQQPQAMTEAKVTQKAAVPADGNQRGFPAPQSFSWYRCSECLLSQDSCGVGIDTGSFGVDDNKPSVRRCSCPSVLTSHVIGSTLT